MSATMTRNPGYAEPRHLYMAMELSSETWLLGFSDGSAERIRQVKVRSGDSEGLQSAVEAAHRHFGISPESPVRSCYEAGRDGFWVHRLLERLGMDNIVIDAASMRVNRRRRRAKTDRLDVENLLVDLVRHHRGERDVWKVVAVPPVEMEDLRRIPRALKRLKKERTQHRARILALFATVGAKVRPGTLNQVLRDLDGVRCWDGGGLGAFLRIEIEQETARLQLVEGQIRELVFAEKQLQGCDKPIGEQVRRLAQLRGIGLDSACLLACELFAWRKFSNRKQLGAIVGLCGTPYNTGNSEREQGISKAGLARVRTRSVELAWQWMRYQPNSELSRWFARRYAAGGKRLRKVGAVAVARKLLIALWRYVESGVVPQGATLKPIGSR